MKIKQRLIKIDWIARTQLGFDFIKFEPNSKTRNHLQAEACKIALDTVNIIWLIKIFPIFQ